MKIISAISQSYQFARLGAALNPRLWHSIKGAPCLARLHPDADATHTARGFHELAKVYSKGPDVMDKGVAVIKGKESALLASSQR